MAYIPKLSWTKLSVLKTCPFKYNQCYNLFNWSPPTIIMTFGTACHTIFEMMYTSGNFDKKYWYDRWEEIYKAAIANQKKLPKLTQKEYKFHLYKGYGMLKRFFETGEKYNFLKGVDVDLVEKKIELKVFGEPFTGYIDLLLPIKEGTEYILTDFKTSQKKRKSDMAQVLVYALCAIKMGYNVTKVAIFYSWLGDIVILDITKEHKAGAVRYLKTVVELYHKLQKSKKYEAKKNEYCKYCHVRAECPLIKTRKRV